MNVLVTGGNAGIGYFTAEQLAEAGATVVLGSRSQAKADAAAASIRARIPGAVVRHMPLDLRDLSSLKSSVDGQDPLDAVVFNAGIALDEPVRRTSADGHELMFATNHLGHFALAYWLAPLLTTARFITVGSFATRSERLDLDDLQSTRDYDPKRTYGRSKLAQMSFGFELDRRLRAVRSNAMSVVVHPGGALDSLTPSRPGVHTRPSSTRIAGLLLHGKDSGARPAVHAVLDPQVEGGQLWGPRQFGLRGKPHLEKPHAHMTDPETAAVLWEKSCELTGLDLGEVLSL
ncbi:SDR family NAD(P)-dependent oxidoreductase [Lentzea sp. BCCO 10_0856]|uniref:SDR family NAD(P)-dependent oxidoreductase n=1 Tax=Lentzea miocenica TaxID=3095431 RepID=A0ABU4ST28_9PSEU|nr:SDR family NAD(P)-dependent oxidoreductase [Lentzea sp. BCCO 10_0856]MDX8029051.1 SDR family NAD(P)-dependent oxidoreductase [Lentzea sp. BCCO 10_0856]